MSAQVLQAHGLKVTPARLQVLLELGKSHAPLSAQALHSLVKGVVNKVTVYRILQTLVNKGIVQTEEFERETLYYLGETTHHHIVCRVCKITQCVPCNHQTPNVKGFSSIEHQYVLTGICTNCN